MLVEILAYTATLIVYIPELKDGICQLCSHPYWTRIWTVQEVALNDNCWIYLGKLKPMEMLTFRGMLYEAEGYMNQTWEGLVQQEPGSLYPVSFRRGSPHSTTTLHEPWNGFTTDDILHNLIAKKARNPLDLVFACRDLLPESFGQIKVDYTRAISDLLREATSRIIPGLRSLGILLSLVCHCPPVPGVPSWTLTLQFDLQLHDVSHYFGVWFPTPPHATTPNTAHVLPDGKTLRARGIIVDHVAFVSDEFPYYTLQHQETWHRHVHALLKRSKASIKEYLTHEFEEAMVYILYAAVTAGEDLAAKIHEFARFEKVSFDLRFGLSFKGKLIKKNPRSTS
jgi:hypothetical protein